MMKTRIYKKLKSKVKNQSGMTLVELIVVFALVGIFMVAATFMLSTSMQLFSRMQATSHAVTVSDLILDKIAGEIVAADIPKKDKGGYYFWLENDTGSPWIAFCNRSGSPVSIYADSSGDATKSPGQGQLFMKYYKISDKKQLNEINWHFDKQVYMNYQISDLKFSRPEPVVHPNVVKIDLTLTNEKTGFTYSTVRYAENYNFDFSTDYMCVRNKVGTGMPKEAEEFRIDANTNPDNPGPDESEKITYYIHFQDKAGKKIKEPESRKDVLGRRIEITEDLTEVLGTTKISPPSVPGYIYDPTSPFNYIESLDDFKNNIYLQYIPVQAGGSIVVTDSNGTKHTLYPNLDWEEVKQTAVANYGYTFSVSDMLCDDTGFYIVINSQYIDKNVEGKTLEEVARKNNSFIKITADTKIWIEENLVDSEGTPKWPGEGVKRGELVFFKDAYYIAEGNTIWDIPPANPWIKLPTGGNHGKSSIN